jgi:paraquat-inducible protein A
MAAPCDVLVCPICDQRHDRPVLRPGEAAACARCGTRLLRRGWLDGRGRTPFLLAAWCLALAAAVTPYVTLGKLGREHAGTVADPGAGLWNFNYATLAALVWFCGLFAPLGVLLVRSLGLSGPATTPAARGARWVGDQVAFWAMPEVQVLGTLVAFFKLGEVVDVAVGPGLWCYGAAAACLLAAGGRERAPVAPEVPR